MRKKILILTPFSPKFVGGAETFCKDLHNEAIKKIDVRIVTLERQFEDWDNPGLLQCFTIFVELTFRALLLRRKFKYETVHCLGIIGTATGAVLKKLFKVKLLSTTLAIYGFEKWPFLKYTCASFIMGHSDIVYVEDSIGEQDIYKLGFSVRKQDVKKFMHWVDLFKLSPPLTRDKKENELDVLFVGRPIRKKGMHIIQFVQERLSHLKGLRFHYVTDISYEDLQSYYQMADVLVVPSLYNEGVARVVIEGCSAGLAVVASARGSLPGLVEPFGMICGIPETYTFEKAIEKLYNDKCQLLSMKVKARNYALLNFSNKNAEVFFEEY